MPHTRVGIIGGGWPGKKHVEGYSAAGGFQVVAVADLIPDRREQLATDAGAAKRYVEAMELVNDPEIDAVSICLPNNLHAEVAVAALKAKKHVLIEPPPARDACTFVAGVRHCPSAQPR